MKSFSETHPSLKDGCVHPGMVRCDADTIHVSDVQRHTVDKAILRKAIDKLKETNQEHIDKTTRYKERADAAIEVLNRLKKELGL